MKIKKFEKYTSDDFGYDYGGHAFVLARYKGGWNNMIGSYFLLFSNDEFVPCMVSGYNRDGFVNLSITVIGNQHTYNIEDFEIIEGSDKGFREMIEIYTSSKKYNL